MNNIADHSGDGLFLGPPRKNSECRRVRHGHHVRLFYILKTGNGRPVESYSVFEGSFELILRNSEALQNAIQIREPESNKFDIMVSDFLENVLFCLHFSTVGTKTGSDSHRYPKLGRPDFPRRS